MAECLTLGHINNKNNISNEEFLSIAGEINYTFSRILAGCMKDVSYGKIVIITGVLENIKQEIASSAITYAANFKILMSSIFFPIQTSIKLLNKVADAYIDPN